MKKFITVLLLVAIFSIASFAVCARELNVDFESVDINGRDLKSSGVNFIKNINRGQQLALHLELNSAERIRDAEIEAEISGYEHGTISDTTQVFDINANTSDDFTLFLDVPELISTEQYTLRITVRDKDDEKVFRYKFNIETDRHDIDIKDVSFANGRSIRAGDVLIAEVRLENNGYKDENDLKVTVRIPELNKEVSDFVDEIDADEELSSEELFVNIDPCTKAGTYTAEILVSYNDGYNVARKTYPINVLESVICATKIIEKPTAGQDSIITVSTDLKQLSATKGAVYPVTITNLGTNKKVYIVQLSGYESFANAQIDQGVVTVDGQSTVTVQPFLTLKDNVKPGTYTFSLKISDGEKTLAQYPITVSVTESTGTQGSTPWAAIETALIIGLIIFIVILIILALIIGYNRMKKSDDKEDDEDEDDNDSYY